MRIEWERLGRLDITPILRGHWRALSENDDATAADWLTRSALIGASLAVTIAAFMLNWSFSAPAAVLSGVALLTGGSLSVFTHLSTLRNKLEEQTDSPAARFNKDALDESAAHLLMATMVAIVDAAVLVIGLNVASERNGALAGIWAALAMGLSTYLFLLFLVLVPRLYNAYTIVNKVRPPLNGFHRMERSRSRR